MGQQKMSKDELGLPWKNSTTGTWIWAPLALHGNIVCNAPDSSFSESYERWPARRDFIVRAANNYYPMVEALEAAFTVFDEDFEAESFNSPLHDVWLKTKIALALAKEEK